MLNAALFILATFAVGAIPALVALRFTTVRIASVIVVVSAILPVLALQFEAIAGPHGFIVFAFLPYWLGCFLAFCVLASRRTEAKSQHRSETK